MRQNLFFLALLAAGTVAAGDSAAGQGVSAASLGHAEGLATACSQADAKNATLYQQGSRAMVNLRSERRLAVIRRTPEYQKAFKDVLVVGIAASPDMVVACELWSQMLPQPEDGADAPVDEATATAPREG